MRFLNTFAVFFFSVIALSAHATEPAYCELQNFKNAEFKTNKNLGRLHAYKLGSLNLVGLAVGNSKASDVAKLAAEFGKATHGDQYCTWYFNKGNKEAERAFTHIYLPNPGSVSEKKAYSTYLSLVGNEFGKNSLSFLSCAEKLGYVAMGCDGMKHRGPTVFGMLLAYSGCSPEKSAAIVNSVWGLNGVPSKNRVAAIRAAYDLGAQEPQYRDELQAIMTGTK